MVRKAERRMVSKMADKEKAIELIGKIRNGSFTYEDFMSLTASAVKK